MNPPPHIAHRMGHIAPFQVMEILHHAQQLSAQGKSIIHMEVGEPDFPTPPPVIEAGIRALQAGLTRYTPTYGIAALREAIAHFYQSRYGVTVAPERVIVTPGASGALQLATAILVNAGERVLMTDPGYPCNRHFVRLVDGEPTNIPVTSADHYQLTESLLERYWDERTVAVLLASPANPTGTVVPFTELQRMNRFIEQRGGRLIMDEIYHGLNYGEPLKTALSLSENVFVINSFSKYFGMTGWRLGWLVVPESHRQAAENLAQNIFIAPSTPAQYAALAAFEPDTLALLDERRAAFQQRRDFLLPALRQLGFDIPVVPEGAFYLYAGCQRFTEDSHQFAWTLLEKVGIAVTPGNDFGVYQANTHLRFTYTLSLDALQQCIARLRQFLL